jgi:hypothetical protein
MKNTFLKLYDEVAELKVKKPHWWAVKLMQESTVEMNWYTCVDYSVKCRCGAEWECLELPAATHWLHELLEDYHYEFEDLMIFH